MQIPHLKRMDFYFRHEFNSFSAIEKNITQLRGQIHVSGNGFPLIHVLSRFQKHAGSPGLPLGMVPPLLHTVQPRTHTYSYTLTQTEPAKGLKGGLTAQTREGRPPRRSCTVGSSKQLNRPPVFLMSLCDVSVNKLQRTTTFLLPRRQ